MEPVSHQILAQHHSSLPKLDYTTLDTIPSGLIQSLSTVPDPRRPQGRRYSAAWLLTIAICTIMCGHTGFRHMHELATRLTIDPSQQVPEPSTFHRFLKQINPDHLDTALAAWATARQNHSTLEPLPEAVAIDGKELRSAKNGRGTKVHLLSAVTHEAGLVLGQVNVHEKTNEITQLPQLLEFLDQQQSLERRVLTLDALHTQRSTATLITQKYKAHYVFTLKGNQQKLHQLIKDMPWEDVPVGDTSIDTGHGRLAVRKLQLATLSKALLPSWPGLAQIAQVVRRRTLQGKTSHETVYILTSLPRWMAGPGWLAELVQGHWAIENKVHHVRDTTFREDQNQIRTGNAPRVVASLTNAVLTLFRSLGWNQIRPLTRRLHANADLLPLVLSMV